MQHGAQRSYNGIIAAAANKRGFHQLLWACRCWRAQLAGRTLPCHGMTPRNSGGRRWNRTSDVMPATWPRIEWGFRVNAARHLYAQSPQNRVGRTCFVWCQHTTRLFGETSCCHSAAPCIPAMSEPPSKPLSKLALNAGASEWKPSWMAAAPAPVAATAPAPVPAPAPAPVLEAPAPVPAPAPAPVPVEVPVVAESVPEPVVSAPAPAEASPAAAAADSTSTPAESAAETPVEEAVDGEGVLNSWFFCERWKNVSPPCVCALLQMALRRNQALSWLATLANT